MGRVGEDLALAQSYEQVEIFARGGRLAGSARSLGERRMRHAERRGVALQRRQAAEQLDDSGPRASKVASSAYSRARA